MDLAIAGQIADILTSIFTILTLVYLALQIRTNTATQQAEARRANAASTSNFLNPIVQNKDVARLWRLGHQDLSSIDTDEQVQFFALLGSILDTELLRFTEKRLNIMTDDDYDGKGQQSQFVHWLTTPGGSIFWNYHRKYVWDDFRDYIDQAMQKLEEDKRLKKAAAAE